MSNTITIELCAEDRARLDKLTAALEALQPPTMHVDLPTPKQVGADNVNKKLAETLAKAEASAEAPKNATEAAKAETLTTTPPKEETPTAKEDAAPWEPTKAEPTEQPKPTVTLEQIQQKVIQLAAGNGGAKKAKVREIINTYGAKVTDLKDQPEKWTEVWGKLTALESEG